MSKDQDESSLPHGWAEDLLMELMVYCTANGLDRVAEAIEPALLTVGALRHTHASSPEATHHGTPTTPQ